jgi:hypothetical protein
VVGELGEEPRIVGERLDLEAGSVRVHAEQLCSVGAEGDLFDLVGVHQLEEIRVANVRGTVLALLNDGSCRGGRIGRRRHVHGHEQRRRRLVMGRDR